MKSILLAVVSLGALVGCDVLSGARAPAPGSQGDGGTSNTAMTRPMHETFFPIVAGAHSATDCNSCHGGFPSFKQFTCISCHDHAQMKTDTAHAGVTAGPHVMLAISDTGIGMNAERKEAIRKYKETKVPRGIFSIRSMSRKTTVPLAKPSSAVR